MKEYVRNIVEGLGLLENVYTSRKAIDIYNKRRELFKRDNLEFHNSIERIIDYEISFSNDFLMYSKLMYHNKENGK